MITIDDIRAAARRIEPVAHRTPVLTSRTLDDAAGATVALKCENFQRIGAFKIRGAYNTIAQLDADQRKHGVVAYSSGNHAQAVALAARELETRAVIVMPEDAPASKLAATEAYGAEIVAYDRYTGDREAIAAEIQAERGCVVVPPYDHESIMAGQGTVGLELAEQAGQFDAVLVPMGGGGLMSGCATAIKALHPDTRMIGVEPEAGGDQYRSLAAGRRVTVDVPRTVADGLATTTPGKLTFEVNRRLVDEVVLVPDDEMLAAMVFLFERMKLVVEPSGAIGVAALMNGRISLPGKRIGVVISGGNIDAARFASLVSA